MKSSTNEMYITLQLLYNVLTTKRVLAASINIHGDCSAKAWLPLLVDLWRIELIYNCLNNNCINC